MDTESPDQHGPSWSPHGDWIAYRRVNAGKWELVKAPLGGGKPVFLAETTQAGAETDWSTTGVWICHPKGEMLELVSPDGPPVESRLDRGSEREGEARRRLGLAAVRYDGRF